MKNFIIAVLVLTLGGLVYYYEFLDEGGESQEELQDDEGVEELRAKLEEFKKSTTVGEKPEEKKEEEVEEETKEEVEEEEEVEVIEEEKPEHTIKITSPGDDDSISSLPIIFTGELSEGATKIVVKAEGGEGDSAYTDVYTLSDFNKGDSTFTYRAKPAWDNLAAGLNEYEFTAHFEDGETVTEYLSIQYQES